MIKSIVTAVVTAVTLAALGAIYEYSTGAISELFASEFLPGTIVAVASPNSCPVGWNNIDVGLLFSDLGQTAGWQNTLPSAGIRADVAVYRAYFCIKP